MAKVIELVKKEEKEVVTLKKAYDQLGAGFEPYYDEEVHYVIGIIVDKATGLPSLATGGARTVGVAELLGMLELSKKLIMDTYVDGN